LYALACTCIYKILVAELFDLGPEGADGERGTGLVDALQFAVADDLGIGIVLLQGAEQPEEGLLLGRGAGVGGAATVVETSLVADADGVGIVVSGVGADHLLGTAEVQLSVAGDVVVIAAALPAAGLVHLVEHPQRQVLVGAARRAVNDNQVYSSHFVCFLNVPQSRWSSESRTMSYMSYAESRQRKTKVK